MNRCNQAGGNGEHLFCHALCVPFDTQCFLFREILKCSSFLSASDAYLKKECSCRSTKHSLFMADFFVVCQPPTPAFGKDIRLDIKKYFSDIFLIRKFLCDFRMRKEASSAMKHILEILLTTFFSNIHPFFCGSVFSLKK